MAQRLAADPSAQYSPVKLGYLLDLATRACAYWFRSQIRRLGFCHPLGRDPVGHVPTNIAGALALDSPGNLAGEKRYGYSCYQELTFQGKSPVKERQVKMHLLPDNRILSPELWIRPLTQLWRRSKGIPSRRSAGIFQVMPRLDEARGASYPKHASQPFQNTKEVKLLDQARGRVSVLTLDRPTPGMGSSVVDASGNVLAAISA